MANTLRIYITHCKKINKKMSGCGHGAARAAPGYATHLHLDAGIGANKSAETKAETIT